MGALYFAAAAVLGGIFLFDALRTWREQNGNVAARRLFRYLAALPRADVRDNGRSTASSRRETRCSGRSARRLRRRARFERARRRRFPRSAASSASRPAIWRGCLRSTARHGRSRSRSQRRWPTATDGAASISRASRSSRWAASSPIVAPNYGIFLAGARDSGARRGRHLSGSHRRDRRRGAARAARRRARNRRRNLGTRGGHRPDARRPGRRTSFRGAGSSSPNIPLAAIVFVTRDARTCRTLAPQRARPARRRRPACCSASGLLAADGRRSSRIATVVIGALGVAVLVGFAFWERTPRTRRSSRSSCFRTPQLAKTYALEIVDRHARGLALLHSHRAGRRAGPLVRGRGLRRRARRVRLRRRDSAVGTRARPHRQPRRAARRHDPHRDRPRDLRAGLHNRCRSRCSR